MGAESSEFPLPTLGRLHPFLGFYYSSEFPHFSIDQRLSQEYIFPYSKIVIRHDLLMADTARSCSQCEETDFEHVYGAVWRCKACGMLSGNVEELAEQPSLTNQPKKVRRRLNTYEN